MEPAVFPIGLAGFLSVFSPCVLPILPFFLALLVGLSRSTMRGQVATAFLFGSGFALVVFWLLTRNGLGEALVRHLAVSRWLAAAAVALIALLLLAKRRLPAVAAFPAGLAFAFGWVPCVGPSLALLLNLPPQISEAQRAVLFSSHALGTILALVGIAAAFWPVGRRLARLRAARVIAAGLLGLFALLIAFDRTNLISAWLLDHFDWSGVLI